MTSAASFVKFALVSHVLPPSSSGQAVVLYRLLRDCDPQQYCLISVKKYADLDPDHEMVGAAADYVTRRLLANYYHLPEMVQYRVLHSRPCQWVRRALSFAGRIRRWFSPVANLRAPAPDVEGPVGRVATRATVVGGWKERCRSFLHSFDDWLNVRRQVKHRARAIFRIVRQESCQAIVACSGDLIDLPAAFLAAQWALVPFFPYMFDDYAWQWIAVFQRQFAQDACRRMMKRAAGVIVPNDFLAQVYREAYQVKPVVVCNPVEEIGPPPPLFPARGEGPLRIVYTGAIYQAHFDAFTHLAQALRRLPEKAAELHLYTSATTSWLAQHGILAPAIVHPQVTNAEAQVLQRTADVLFLPLAFDSPIPEIIRTSAPGKMGELLASGRPVLVHAPRDSFVSSYCRTHQCGAVVDEPEPELLRRTLLRLRQEPAWVAHLVHNARERARTDFHVTNARKRFFQLLNHKE